MSLNMLEAVEKTLQSKFTPTGPGAPELSDEKWAAIEVWAELLNMFKKLRSQACLEISFMRKLSDLNTILRQFTNRATFLDDVLPYYGYHQACPRYGIKYRRLTDKLLAVDTSVHNFIILPYSGSMGRVLDMNQIQITHVFQDEVSCLNYDLTTDNELKAMMDYDVAPLTHEELCKTLETLPENRVKKICHMLNVHAECKILMHFVNEEIDGYHYIGTSKLSCAACWLFFTAYNELVHEQNQIPNKRRLKVYRGSNSHVYQWAAPDFCLTDGVLDKMGPLAETFFRRLCPKHHYRMMSESGTGSMPGTAITIPWDDMEIQN